MKPAGINEARAWPWALALAVNLAILFGSVLLWPRPSDRSLAATLCRAAPGTVSGFLGVIGGTLVRIVRARRRARVGKPILQSEIAKGELTELELW